MGTEAIIAILVGLSATLGGFFEGRRRGKSQNISDEMNTVTMFQAAIAELERQNSVKDLLIADLTGRISTLESMITQRADVEAVKREVEGVRDVVNRIAEAVKA